MSFTYLSSKLSALSDGLLSASTVERMIDSKKEDSVKVLNDLSYSDFIDESCDLDNFEKYIDADFLNLKNILKNSLDHDLYKGLLLDFDLQNARLSFNALLKNKDLEFISKDLTDFSFFPKDYFYRFFSDDASLNFENLILGGLSTIYKEIRDTKIDLNFKDVDLKIYGVFLNYIFSNNKDKILCDYYSKRLDIENIKSIFYNNISLMIGSEGIFTTEVDKNSYYSDSIFYDDLKYILDNNCGFFTWENMLEVKLLSYLKDKSFLYPNSFYDILYFVNLKLFNLKLTKAILISKKNNYKHEEIFKNLKVMIDFVMGK